ncbi:hypothetical protein ElyMa_005759700 [Elysia marginata]|uniref:Uncharacterized protein n=1 Tax=Elysia marginata TaxID=1093978 RepID=A0AAV4FP80_9GAST|nr:hypothetical protein ElyMa_005759700 [Elysia marginata]
MRGSSMSITACDTAWRGDGRHQDHKAIARNTKTLPKQSLKPDQLRLVPTTTARSTAVQCGRGKSASGTTFELKVKLPTRKPQLEFGTYLVNRLADPKSYYQPQSRSKNSGLDSLQGTSVYIRQSFRAKLRVAVVAGVRGRAHLAISKRERGYNS